MADQDNKNEITPPENPAEKSDAQPEGLSPEAQNILNAFDQANLEVADMPESNELQERRRKTKNKLQELSETNETQEDALDEGSFENEEGGLMDLLREANLKPRQLGFCCLGVLVVALVAGMVYGGIRWWQNRPSTEEPVDESVQEDQVNQEEEEDSSVSSFADPTLEAGMLLGETEASDAGTAVGEDLGSAADSSDELTQMMLDFAKMYHAMEVDVNELLSESTDRREALNEYQNNLGYLLYVGEQNQKLLTQESDDLVASFEGVETEKDLQEETFFARLRELDAYGSSAALDAFVKQGQEVIRLRAEYQARQKLLTYYAQLIVDLQNRVEDIELNEEALVKGIQVVDISGSDLNLIIDESEL